MAVEPDGVHDGPLAPLDTVVFLHSDLLDTVQTDRSTDRDTGSEMGSQVPRSAVAGGEDQVPEPPGEAVHSELLHLTVCHRLIHSDEILGHGDVFDGAQHVVTLSTEH